MALHTSWNLRTYNIQGSQPPYPGESQYAFGNAYKTTSYIWNTGFDWTLNPNLVNSASVGVQSNGESFYSGANPQQWSPYGNRQIYSGLINPTIPDYFQANVLPFLRNNPVYQVRDDLTWTHGRHTFQMGGLFMHTSFWETSYGGAGVPIYSLGIAQGDPAANVLAAALPDINTDNGDLDNADNLFALLTGRVSSIYGWTNVDENTHKYAEFQPATQRWAFTSGNLYFQDSFRMTPNFTVNYGLNWMLNGPIKSTNGIDGEPGPGSFFGPSTGLNQPGTLGGVTDPQYVVATSPYKSDLNNLSPSLGFAWNPHGGHGWLGNLLGQNKTVFRGSYALHHYNEGMNTISNTIQDNPGATQTLSAYPNYSPGYPYGLTLSSPAPTYAQFPSSFGYPMPESQFALAGGQSLGYVNPNLRTPYTQSWNFGIQRELPGNTVVEVRYMGNKSTHMWHYENLNEVNIFENGFLTQFQQAQKNLAANQANGVKSFADNGFAGQAPTPIFDAAFGANGAYGALPDSSGYTNENFIVDLQRGVAGTMACALASTSSGSPGYYCRMVGNAFQPCAAAGFTAAGSYPINFFTPNPYATSLYYQDDNGDNNYNALQVDVRKTLGHGLEYTANFTWSHSLGDISNADDQTATAQWFTYRDARLNYGPTPFDHRFAWNSFWTYDLPMGKGHALDPGGVLDRVVGGWTLGGTEQISTGAPVLLNSGRDTFNNLSQSGVVLGNGLSPAQLQHDLSTIPNKSNVVNGSLMSNVSAIAQSSGAANPADYAVASTPGAFGQFVYLRQTPAVSLNMSLNKSIQLYDRFHVNIRMEDLNFLNHPFFALGNTSVTSNSFGQVSSASGTRTILLRTSVSW